MSLKEKVMVVNLNISQWTARKYDKGVSREVERLHEATDAGRYNKMLIAADALKTISKIAGSARTYHYYNTLPWGDNGERILPAANYFNYLGEMGKFKQEFEQKVAEFIARYPDLKEDARLRLGTMFNEAEYPMTGDVAGKFKLRFNFFPVADTDDIRVNISEDEINRIKSEVEGAINDRVQFAQADMLNRIREAVSHMAETLKVPDKVFRDSLVGNVCSLIETVPLLNFNDNKHISEVIKMIEPLCVKPEQLRDDKAFRKEIADRAAKVLNHI